MGIKIMNISILKNKISIIKKMIKLYQELLRKMRSRKVDIIIHHTATDRDRTSSEAINNNHRQRGYSKSSLGYYCAYNCLITADGVKHWSRQLDESGHGTSAYKGFHIDLCLTGNFELEKPTDDQP